MRGMVLAAGKGIRLLPLTARLPKLIAPIAGKPMLHYIFELLAESGIEEVYANVFHLAEAILGCYRNACVNVSMLGSPSCIGAPK